MAAYKVIFREEDNPQTEQHLTWEEGCPVSLSAVQISRNTTTSESFLQVKVINISAQMVSTIQADAVIEYEDKTTESIRLEDLDADVNAGDYYTFKAQALSRGNAARADVRILRVGLGYGNGTWESTKQPAPSVWGNKLALTDEQASARSAYLTEAGCSDPSGAIRAACDHDTFWTCTCGQVNLAPKCARCKLDKQAAMQASDIEIIGKLTEAHTKAAKEAEEKAQAQRNKRNKLISVVVCAIALIGVAYLIVTNVSRAGWGVAGATNRGAHVVSKCEFTNSEGKTTKLEYELDEHGNIRKSKDMTENSTATYEYDDFGNVIKCDNGKYSYEQKVDSTDEHGQPTKITRTDADGDSRTYEITWYPGEGHVKQTVFSFPIGDSLYTHTDHFSEGGEKTRSDGLFDEPAGSPIPDMEFHTDYTYEHDHDGKVISRTGKDEDGKVTKDEYVYDESGNVVKRIEDGKTVGTYEYTYIENASPKVLMESNHFLRECNF